MNKLGSHYTTVLFSVLQLKGICGPVKCGQVRYTTALLIKKASLHDVGLRAIGALRDGLL